MKRRHGGGPLATFALFAGLDADALEKQADVLGHSRPILAVSLRRLGQYITFALRRGRLPDKVA
ncbi:MAG: hypothetical protein BWZ02_03343 [Lentisphaerae bacterium ADurb.BinA184]|nr:MAG: hypothetical protein BWZ02_03343 [Lentisphaerae bacterium ADurb.BinA184]